MTQNKDRKQAIRSLADALGVPYSAAARRLGSPRRSAAVVEYTGSQGWRVTIPETAGQGGRGVWTPQAGGWQRALYDGVARDVGCYGWDPAGWPDAPSLPERFEVPLVRNVCGHRTDEAERLHQAAGVTYHKAHDAYVEAVAATVEALGIVTGDLGCDSDEPRDGSFRIGGDLEDLWDDDEGYGPSRVIQWREDLGWYSIWFSDSQAALGDYTEDLPVSLVATPEKVAAAVRDLLGRHEELPEDGPVPPVPVWQMPGLYEADPPAPGGEWWDVSPRLERSLTAYVGLQPPEGLPAWLTRS